MFQDLDDEGLLEAGICELEEPVKERKKILIEEGALIRRLTQPGNLGKMLVEVIDEELSP